jgi:hypothetical protein
MAGIVVAWEGGVASGDPLAILRSLVPEIQGRMLRLRSSKRRYTLDLIDEQRRQVVLDSQITGDAVRMSVGKFVAMYRSRKPEAPEQ